MIADPYKKAVSGQPLRLEAAAWNRFIDVASARGDSGSGSPEFGDVPTLTVRVKNNTGGDLPALSVLKVGASVFTDWTKLLRNLDAPMFGGTTPAAATDAFAVLVEPVRNGKFGLGVVSGAVPVEVNVTDAGHGFAAPGATTARLTSAASGPARILDRESGTGNKKAWVLLEGAGGSSGLTYLTNNSFAGSVTATGTASASALLQADVLTLTAGTWLLWFSVAYSISGGTFNTGDYTLARFSLVPDDLTDDPVASDAVTSVSVIDGTTNSSISGWLSGFGFYTAASTTGLDAYGLTQSNQNDRTIQFGGTGNGVGDTGLENQGPRIAALKVA